MESGLERARMETDLQEGGWNKRQTGGRTRGHDDGLDLKEHQEEEFKMPPVFWLKQRIEGSAVF